MNKKLLFALCFVMTLSIACTSNPQEPVEEPTPVEDTTWKASMHEALCAIYEYIPYNGIDYQYFMNPLGLVDTTRFAITERDSFAIEHESEEEWYCSLSAKSKYREYPGEFYFHFFFIHDHGTEHIVMDAGIIDYIESEETTRGFACWYGGFGKAVPYDERASLWKDTIRLDYAYTEDSAYVLLVRHKGLVEYSFDGQEIWRLVEE